jgi:hypothetical protein
MKSLEMLISNPFVAAVGWSANPTLIQGAEKLDTYC